MVTFYKIYTKCTCAECASHNILAVFVHVPIDESFNTLYLHDVEPGEMITVDSNTLSTLNADIQYIPVECDNSKSLIKYIRWMPRAADDRTSLAVFRMIEQIIMDVMANEGVRINYFTS